MNGIGMGQTFLSRAFLSRAFLKRAFLGFVIGGVLITSVGVLPGELASAEQTNFGYPPTISLDDVRQWIDKAPTDHPRLLAREADFVALRKSLAAESSNSDSARQTLARAVIKQATLLRDAAPITRTLQGRRLLGESRRCVKRVVVLAMAYQLTGDVGHVRRCEKEMLAAARFSDFNPSHFLDVAEMTFALAIGYDWLYDQLDAAARDEIRAAIIDKGVTLPFTTRHKGWVDASNNWGQVCHGGLTAGALAVMEHDKDLAARTVHNALHHVTRSMRSYAPVGSYPEGPGYWAYGTGYNVLLIGVLESVLKTDFGLTKAPGFSQTGQYVSLTCGPSGAFFNYADGGSGRSPQPSLFWFASRFDRPDWLLGERERLIERVANVSEKDAVSGSDRLLPLALLWMGKETDNITIKMPLHWHGEGETPVTIHRSSWTDPHATFVGVKAGSPSGSHGQMDIGSFVLDADGVRWAVDLGAEGYHGIESRGMNLWSRAQNSDRWTIFRQCNQGHNTLVIDDQLQLASGKGKIISFSDDPKSPHTTVDMSSVYEGQAETVRRTVSLVRSRDVLIEDELTGLKPGSRVRWGMITPGEPDTSDGPQITLRQKGASLKLTIMSPKATAWQTIDTATPRNEWDSPNRGTRMIAFEAVAPESGKLTLTVLAAPGETK